jgi:hypothetical protein
VETIEALRLVWSGEPTTYEGRFVALDGAICSPPPPVPPRVVVGVGGSRRALHGLLPVADELNLYTDEALVTEARDAIAASGRDVSLSVFLSWEWDKWPADPIPELQSWAARGVDRACVSIGGSDMERRIEVLSEAARAV